MKTFTVETGKTRMTFVLSDEGKYLRTSAEGPGYAFVGETEEFFFTWNGVKVSGADAGWKFAGEETAEGTQGEKILRVSLEKEGIRVTREYTAYPGQSAVGSRTIFTNLSAEKAILTDPSLLIHRDGGRNTAFGYMTGGANFTGSLMYKELEVKEGLSREFDSHGAPEVSEVEGRTCNDMHPVPNGAGIWCELYTFRGEKGYAWVTFDFQGWWLSRFTRADEQSALKVWCALKGREVAPGEAVPTANTVLGFAAGDIDDVGNDINAYIYAYKWDYTHPRYFMEPTETIWREAPLTDKIWYLTREAQKIGARQVHVDDFWFDAKGNWENIFGDDFREYNDYLKRLGMDFRLWMPPWHADRLSQVWLDHPDWMLNFHGNWYNWTIDMSREEAYQWILNMLCEKQKQFGTYMLRVDGNPTCLQNDGSFTTSGGNYDAAFDQSANFYRLYKEFKDRNPDAGLNGCSSGGHTMTIEAVRYTDTQQITDGQCLHYGQYWATLFNPVDKISGIGGGAMNQNPTTDFRSPEWFRNSRRRVLFGNWAAKVGLSGRGILVYRPEVKIGDRTFYMERLSADRKRGLLTLNGGVNPFWGKPEVVYPKGLLPGEDYTVDFFDGDAPAVTRKGAEWMEKGIEIPEAKGGIRIGLNLQDRPGMGKAEGVPAPVAKLTLSKEKWLNREGMMLQWELPAYLFEYIEVEKNGEVLAEVGYGTGWFDETWQEGDVYRVRVADMDGKLSEYTEVSPQA